MRVVKAMIHVKATIWEPCSLTSLISSIFLTPLQEMNVKQITISVPESQFRLIETQRGLVSRSKFVQNLLQTSLSMETTK